MRLCIAMCLLAMLPPTALPQEQPDAPWVCVPTQQFGWLCGRGANAPEPRPLPVAPPPTPQTLPGYTLPAQSAGEALLPESVESVLAPESETENPPPETRAAPEPAPAVTPPPAKPEAGPRYGVQLVAVRNPASLDGFIRAHGLQAHEVYRRTWRDAGGVWYVLLTGHFASVEQAANALHALPPELQQAGAWVRRVDQLDRP